MRGKRFVFLRGIMILFLSGMALFLWTAKAEEEAHYTPEYARENLEPFLKKAIPAESDYEILFRQTGLTRAGVDELYHEGRQEELLFLQERFFAPVKYRCSHLNAFCRSERLIPETEEATENFLPTVRTGDILLTFSGHVFGWRSGHAGIVVDGEAGLTLEAITLGCDSKLCETEHWREYPSVALLRLKDSTEEETAAIAAYAMENLSGIPYDLASFTDNCGEISLTGRPAAASGENSESISGTQCAHLVWAAFKHFGYDLNSDGGYIVTPEDLFESDLLEVVQLYGIDLSRIP